MKRNRAKLALFDMDGTLTPARQKITKHMVESILNLLSVTRVGIVSGSGIDYIEQQCGDLIDEILVRDELVSRFVIMPCNGTKLYSLDKKHRKKKLHDVSMSEKMGAANYNALVRKMMQLTLEVHEKHDIPCTGTFISYRGSMLNWAIPGRDCTLEQREDYHKIDSRLKIRESLVSEIKSYIEKHISCGIETAIGGEISIDIFPAGWDKTYALTHHPTAMYSFVGDKCFPGGNDYSIYKLLKSTGHISFSSCNPDETCGIISNELIPYFS